MDSFLTEFSAALRMMSIMNCTKWRS